MEVEKFFYSKNPSTGSNPSNLGISIFMEQSTGETSEPVKMPSVLEAEGFKGLKAPMDLLEDPWVSERSSSKRESTDVLNYWIVWWMDSCCPSSLVSKVACSVCKAERISEFAMKNESTNDTFLIHETERNIEITTTSSECLLQRKKLRSLRMRNKRKKSQREKENGSFISCLPETTKLKNI